MYDGQPFTKVEHELMNWLPEIGPDAFAVWAVISRNYVRKYNNVKFIGIRELAKQAGMWPPTATKAIQVLEQHGLIERHQPKKARYTVKGGRPPQLYKPVLPVPPPPE